VLDLPFDRIHGAFEGATILRGGRDAVERGRRRYLRALAGELPGMRPRSAAQPADDGPAT